MKMDGLSSLISLIMENNMPNMIEIYDELVKEHDHSRKGFTDKHLPYHTYISYYDKEFEKYRKNVKLLEIGVWRGGSMFLWTKYFDKYKLEGLDINATTLDGFPFKEKLENDSNVKWHLGHSSTDAEYAKNFKKNYFDIIVDDGAHDVTTQFETFKIYFDKLAKTGTYYIEDVLNDPSMEDLKTLISNHTLDSVTLDVYKGTIGRPDDLILKIQRK